MSYKDFKTLSNIIEETIHFNYLANAQKSLLKYYFEKKLSTKLTDDYFNRLINNYSILKIDNFIRLSYYDLTTEENEKLYGNLEMIVKLKNILSIYYEKKYAKDLESAINLKVRRFNKKSDAINNVKELNRLNNLGLQEYIDDKVDNLMEMNQEERNYYRNDFGLIFKDPVITKDKEIIKTLKK